MTHGAWDLAQTPGSEFYKVWDGDDDKFHENAYSMRWRLAPGTPFRYRSIYSGWINCNRESFGIHLPAQDSQYWAGLTTKTLNKIMGQYKQHDFNLGTFLGELPETVEMVVKAGLSIYHAYKSVRKGRFHQALSILRKANLEHGRKFRVDKTAPSAWLSLRFGWIPLMSDAKNAVYAYAKGAFRPRFTKLRARSRKTVELPTGNSAVGGMRYVDRCKQVYSLQIVLKTYYKPSVYKQLGLLDPEVVVWELVPFSFVVDYFYDIGTWLELHAVLPTKESTYITTRFYRGELNGIRQNPSTEGPFFDPPYVPCRLSDVSVNRTVENQPVIPPPRFKNPFLSMVKVVNMLALLNNLRK